MTYYNSRNFLEIAFLYSSSGVFSISQEQKSLTPYLFLLF